MGSALDLASFLDLLEDFLSFEDDFLAGTSISGSGGTSMSFSRSSIGKPPGTGETDCGGAGGGDGSFSFFLEIVFEVTALFLDFLSTIGSGTARRASWTATAGHERQRPAVNHL